MPKRTNPATHALLRLVPPTHTTTATLFPFHRRHLQLRNNILLISRKPTFPLPSPSTQTITLSPTTPIKKLSSTTLQISRNRLSFSSSKSLSAFLESLHRATRRLSYTTLARIGSGASGNVYLVKDSSGRLLAHKQIPKREAFYSRIHLSRLIAERMALAEARESGSPFIVQLVDAFETRTHLNLIMELAALGDLHTFVTKAEGKRLSEDIARSVFAEVVLGLEDLHRMGFLYRDMKLNNLLLTENGHVRLADFGLVKRLNVVPESVSMSSVSSDSEDDEEFRLLGRTKSFVGTRRYMSPEHLISGHGSTHGYGAPADIWALGVVLYVMLTGRYPFGNGISSGNSAGLFTSIRNDELEFPEFVSAEARHLLTGLLERDSMERLELPQIKSHKWLRDVNWNNVREDARNDVRKDDIVTVASGRIEDRFEFMESAQLSECSVEDKEVFGRRKDSSLRLLGFGFVEDQ